MVLPGLKRPPDRQAEDSPLSFVSKHSAASEISLKIRTPGSFLKPHPHSFPAHCPSLPRLGQQPSSHCWTLPITATLSWISPATMVLLGEVKQKANISSSFFPRMCQHPSPWFSPHTLFSGVLHFLGIT